MRIPVRLFLLASALCALLAVPSNAATVWYVDVDAPSGGDGLGWATAFQNPQGALAVASPWDEIRVAEGTCYPTSDTTRTISFALVEGVALYGGYAGFGELDPDERDPAAHVTVLSGDLGVIGDPADNSYHVVVGAFGATLDGFTVAEGNADGWGQEDYGGGMYNRRINNIVIANCIFVGNRSEEDGGGLFNEDVVGLSILGCVFMHNHAEDDGGGAYYYDCQDTAISDCTFTGNTTASCGGAMRMLWSQATVADCLFSDNVASGLGGAVQLCNSSSVLIGCKFLRNSASDCGGAIWNDSSTTEIAGCLFFANEVVFADPRGGAVYGSGIMRFRSCTFSSNSAYRGGAFYLSRALTTITNCIVWGNSTTNGPDIFTDRDSATAVTNSCMEQTDLLDDGRNFSADPLFVDAAGGDLRLQQGSPCIDAADGDAAPTLDLDGNSRHDDSGVANRGTGAIAFADIGAFEFQGDTAGSWLKLYSPTQTHAFRVGDTLDVNWDSTSDIANIRVELSRSGGPWVELAAATANDGEFVWTVDDGGQALPQTNCAIRISDASDGNPSLTSPTFDVFSGIWYVDADVAGGDGYTWTTALSRLEDALALARPGDQIWVAEGTYKPTTGTDRRGSFVILEGMEVYGGFAGTPGTEGNLGASDPDTHVTILSGDIGVEGDSTDNSFSVVLGASNMTIDGFTVTGGSSGSGGIAIELYRAVSGIVIRDCLFTDNLKAMSCESAEGMVVADCTFTNNNSGFGAAAVSLLNSSLAFTNSTFSDNYTSINGAALVSSDSTIEMTNCILSGNTALDEGGAIYLYETQAELTACSFLGNSADAGGGIFVYRTQASVKACRFLGNFANTGGGIHSQYCEPDISNCVFVGNSAGYRGGGIANYWNAVAEIVNCSFSLNDSVTEGGGIFNMYDTTTMTNCVLWSNTAPDGPDIFDDGEPTTVNYSCVGQPGYAGIDGNIGSDPLFVDADGLDDIPGTLDDDLTLQSGSPCIDAADGDEALNSDIEGLGRWDDPATTNTGVGAIAFADMGAHEFGGGPGVVSTTPVAGATSVDIGSAITVTFNMDMNAAATEGAFSIDPALTGTASCVDSILAFTPDSPLATDTEYTVTISTLAIDLVGGKPLSADYVFAFETPDTIPPQVMEVRADGVAILDGGTIFCPPTTIEIDFDEEIDPATVTTDTVSLVASGGDGTFGDGNEVEVVLDPGDVTPDAAGTTATVDLAGLTLADETYRFAAAGSAPPRVADIAGNALDGDGDTFAGGDFTTTFTIDAPLPEVDTVDPAPGSTAYTVPTEVTVTFTKQMDPTTVNESTIRLIGSGGDGTFGDGNEIVIAPDFVTLTSPTAAEMDLVGAPLANDVYRLTVSGMAIGASLDFDGTDDYVAIVPSPDLGGGSFTVEAWVYRRDGLSRKFVSKWNDLTAKKQFDLQVYSDSRLWFEVRQSDDTAVIARGMTVLTTGEWHHVAAIADTTTSELSLYIDGVKEVLQSSPGWDGTVRSVYMEMNIGRKCTGGGCWDGYIDEVRVWNVARTQADILVGMYGGLVGDEPGLVGYYRFDEGSGQGISDSSLSGMDGALGGSDAAGSDDPSWAALASPLCDGIKDVFGNMLDGDGDTLAGGDYVSTFTVETPLPVIDDCAAGPGDRRFMLLLPLALALLCLKRRRPRAPRSRR